MREAKRSEDLNFGTLSERGTRETLQILVTPLVNPCVLTPMQVKEQLIQELELQFSKEGEGR